MIQFGLSVVLARLLSPEDYGLMAMALVFTGFAGILAEGGFSTALVQRQNLSDVQCYTVFWMNLGVSALIAFSMFCLAPWLAEFYQTRSLTTIFRVISLNFLLGCLGSVPAALLQKRMQFKLIARNDSVAIFLSGLVGIVLALRGAGVWSLVAQTLTSSFLNSILRCWSCRWLPRLQFSLTALEELLGFSLHYYGFCFINYWARNADNLIIGKVFGSGALGVYTRAYSLMQLPASQINTAVSQVIFPAFAGIQDDKERVKRIYLRAIGIVSLIGFPIMAGLMAVAVPFVQTIYGIKWSEVSPILQILAGVGMIQTVVSSVGWLYMSQGRTRTMFLMGAIGGSLAIASFVIGALIGSMRGVAMCYAVLNLLYCYPALSVAGRIINLKASAIFAAVAGPFFAAMIMACSVYCVGFLVPSHWIPGQGLALMVITGISLYLLIVHFFRLSALEDLVNLIVMFSKTDKRNARLFLDA